jgi:hypothetical protein
MGHSSVLAREKMNAVMVTLLSGPRRWSRPSDAFELDVLEYTPSRHNLHGVEQAGKLAAFLTGWSRHLCLR